MHLVDFIFLLGGAPITKKKGVMCMVCLFVWLSGRAEKGRSEAWRPADEL